MSERVWAGATVTRVAVWTPMVHVLDRAATTTLSARSRMTSSSNSFQPATLFSTRAERRACVETVEDGAAQLAVVAR